MYINAINPTTNNYRYSHQTNFKGDRFNTIKKAAGLGLTLGLGALTAAAVDFFSNKIKTKTKETYNNTKNEILSDAPQNVKDSVETAENLTAASYYGIKQLLKSV